MESTRLRSRFVYEARKSALDAHLRAAVPPAACDSLRRRVGLSLSSKTRVAHSRRKTYTKIQFVRHKGSCTNNRYESTHELIDSLRPAITEFLPIEVFVLPNPLNAADSHASRRSCCSLLCETRMTLVQRAATND